MLAGGRSESRFYVNGATASRTVAREHPRIWLDVLLLGCTGLVLAELGPYGTIDAPKLLRTAYWLVAVFVCGVAGILADRLLASRVAALWVRIAAVSLVATPPLALFIYALNAVMLDLPRRWWLMPQLAWQVLVVMALLMTLRGLLWRREIETRTVVMPPLPDAEREFRLRLSAKHRTARMIAVQAEDHYVRVYTDVGSELVPMRFSEAVEELSGAYGYRLHRSWWVPAEAIEAVRWTRGGGEVRLSGGMVAPVSRAHVPALKAAGWR